MYPKVHCDMVTTNAILLRYCLGWPWIKSVVASAAAGARRQGGREALIAPSFADAAHWIRDSKKLFATSNFWLHGPVPEMPLPILLPLPLPLPVAKALCLEESVRWLLLAANNLHSSGLVPGFRTAIGKNNDEGCRNNEGRLNARSVATLDVNV